MMKKILIVSLLTILLNLTSAWAQFIVSIADTITTCNSSYNLSASPYGGGTAPFSYLWNTGATTQSITVTQSGDYTITITDAVGAMASATSTVFMSNLQINSNTNCIAVGGTAILSADVSSGYPMTPYTYSWSNGQTSPTISVNAGGNYDCTVTDLTGCVSTTQYTIADCPPLTSSITGKAFFDTNTNGIFDGADTPIPYHPITLSPGNTTILTNAQGVYQFNVDTLVSYTITVSNVGNAVAATPTYTISFPNSGMISTGNDFAFLPNTDLACYLIPYTNAAPGFPVYYELFYNNAGQYAVNGTTVSMTYSPTLQYYYANPVPTTIVGNTLTWNTGNLPPNLMGNIFIYFTTPVGTTLGTIVSSSAEITLPINDINVANNTSTSVLIVQGSFDPNDKTVSIAQMPLPVALSGKELDYTVQFQNTGTAAAQTVVLMDTLDEKLDISSFEMLVSSHVFSLEILQNHILKWTFNNIQLPDSFSNEPESHGFVHYRIRPKNNLNVGDIIHNVAAIYFDFNLPIFTQDATTTIVSPDALHNELSISHLAIVPNPAKEACMLSFTAKEGNEAQIYLYNANGNLIYTENIIGNVTHFSKEIPLNAIPSGIYFLQVVTGKGIVGQRIIKK